TYIIIYFYVCTADMTQFTRFTFYFGSYIAGMHPYCFTVQCTAIPRIVAYLFSQVNFKGLSLILGKLVNQILLSAPCGVISISGTFYIKGFGLFINTDMRMCR